MGPVYSKAAFRQAFTAAFAALGKDAAKLSFIYGNWANYRCRGRRS